MQSLCADPSRRRDLDSWLASLAASNHTTLPQHQSVLVFVHQSTSYLVSTLVRSYIPPFSSHANDHHPVVASSFLLSSAFFSPRDCINATRLVRGFFYIIFYPPPPAPLQRCKSLSGASFDQVLTADYLAQILFYTSRPRTTHFASP